MENKLFFVAVEFPDDPNVAGWTYWYACGFAGAREGDGVVAPLGRHNRLQKGIIRRVLYATEEQAPYPVNLIKSVAAIDGR